MTNKDTEQAGDARLIGPFLSQLNDMANQTTDVDEGLRSFLRSVCEFSNWPVGHAYVCDGTGGRLVSSRQWYLKDAEPFAAFVDVSEKATFDSGVGLPGRVLASGEPSWIRNVMKDANFPRNKQAENLGVKGAFAVPIKIGANVVAVAEFFASEEAEASDMLIGLMLTAASQMARVIERDKRASAITQLMRSFEDRILSGVGQVRDATGRLTEMAAEMGSAATAASNSVNEIAATAGTTSRDVSSVAAATHELTTSIEDLEERTNRTAEKVGEATSYSEQVRQSLGSLLATAKTISSVRDEIQALAKQTHMLSLNASIEAARAGGETGRAFNVVAREVQELAKATAEQTSQIGDRVQAIHEAAKVVETNVDQIHAGVNEVQTLAQSNRESLEAQKNASNAISQDAQSAADGTGKVSAEVETVASVVEQTNTSAQELDKASRQVDTDVSAIKEELDAFLAEIRDLV